ncbi:hypothetical protein SPI_08125 [Niveomyces insectorum RCEF 264]|uniref:Uncharacterized protein n=1 Tax=Niveomyces insectorum RCEF 264 TaxID=1081102 RepID=A0A167NTW3_9HYPO|nr:hypothetical protein SPI_08125 [Niveomyces insectorum RCEF 264]
MAALPPRKTAAMVSTTTVRSIRVKTASNAFSADTHNHNNNNNNDSIACFLDSPNGGVRRL